MKARLPEWRPAAWQGSSGSGGSSRGPSAPEQATLRETQPLVLDCRCAVVVQSIPFNHPCDRDVATAAAARAAVDASFDSEGV